ncbi:helix turn helix multiple antibiotic resistance protein [Trichococcus palustris]|jgi:DNA-binding MarR family transcriptional regulator|uniref:Helix turn helix multiple antibiotic resistance protein n=1 Tax=Trichococcus palustris TaxID=140314 RepID=A0A143YCU2_9LACT|nr:MarR family transcriptional regulator [Trichococcus palustris]CZQ85704.1 helix turn helix multiple antibiotic resistance protein [Trichococcus palustris]SFK56644.1 DNA-binding transcriptional regulator, MarR family [Trichococcus palustris]
MTSLIERWIEFTRMQRSTAEVLENKLLESSKLTLNEYYVLYFLNKAKNKKMRLNDLQIEIGLSQSAMSRMISRMEDKNCGVIERHICSDDKRGVYISLTQSGINMLEKGQIIVDDVLQDLLK